VVWAEEWHRLGGGVVLDGQRWDVIKLRRVSINIPKNRVTLTFRVKAPCSPQSVGSGDMGLVDEAVVALSTVMELAEVLKLKVESEALLIKVVNVRINEVGVGDVRDDEVGAIDSVHVSSGRDVEFAEFGRTEVVKVDVVVDVD
jgi:hypothetical protein